jgi:micrococcal nuclease
MNNKGLLKQSSKIKLPFDPQIVTAKYQKHDDGDTVIVQGGFTAVVRIARIDAPEVPHTLQQKAFKSKVALSQYKWGKAAKDAITSKIEEQGLNITFETVGFDNRYNRNLAMARFHDGTDWGTHLVELGLAMVYDKYAVLGLDYEQLKNAERIAKEKKKGLWSDPDFVAPWEFRKLLNLNVVD